MKRLKLSLSQAVRDGCYHNPMAAKLSEVSCQVGYLLPLQSSSY